MWKRDPFWNGHVQEFAQGLPTLFHIESQESLFWDALLNATIVFVVGFLESVPVHIHIWFVPRGRVLEFAFKRWQQGFYRWKPFEWGRSQDVDEWGGHHPAINIFVGVVADSQNCFHVFLFGYPFVICRFEGSIVSPQSENFVDFVDIDLLLIPEIVDVG